jgi:probable selenium-dependent hydroxylase accessory protein YqeC
MMNTDMLGIQFINLLGIAEKCVVAVIGCGGKTSLIELISGKLLDKKVLVSPTTKMYPMRVPETVLCQTLQQCEAHKPQTGIQCLGILNEQTGKLEPLPDYVLADMIPRYDITLLEADGSMGLPCKGWLDNEPVVPDYCTHTIGILTLRVIGKPANGAVVHRLPEFLSLTGLREGDTITAETMESMVCSLQGMFRKSAGQRYLVVNQAEDSETMDVARSFLQTISEKYPNRFARLIYGSVQLDQWYECH